MQRRYGWRWVQKQAALAADLWLACRNTPPANGARFSNDEHNRREAAYDAALNSVEGELRRTPSTFVSGSSPGVFVFDSSFCAMLFLSQVSDCLFYFVSQRTRILAVWIQSPTKRDPRSSVPRHDSLCWKHAIHILQIDRKDRNGEPHRQKTNS
jgi:hypothetical protein